MEDNKNFTDENTLSKHEDLELVKNAASSNKKESENKKKPKRKKSFGRMFFKFILISTIICTAVGLGSAYALFQWASRDLPSFSKVADFRPAQVTTVLARDGSLIGQFYREKRYVIDLASMSKYVPMAFLAVEDSEFYEHPGVNLLAIFRAAVANFQSGSIKQGGSTITQQIVKRLMLTPEKSYERKLKEAILAFRLEQQLSKDDILSVYLNQIFLGNNAYGVEAAARTYFNKHASDLSIAESAMLAGLPQSPSANNPYRYPVAAKKRQEHVLRRMRDLGWISDEEFDKAVHEKLFYGTMPTFMGRVGGWYLEEVRRQLLDIFNEENSARLGFDLGVYGADVVYEMGLTVHTSMDPIQQNFADKALRKGLEDASKRHGWFGPIEKIAPAKIQAYLEKNKFNYNKFEKEEWQKALVMSVEKGGAKVKIGRLDGFIPVANMGWARKPNKEINGLWRANSTKDAREVLAVGDLVWVSLKFPSEKEAKKSPQFYKDLVDIRMEKGKTLLLALEQYPKVQGGFVAIEPQTGDVVALVGGYEFSYDGDQFNRATQAFRQPGSSFKPVIYSAAIDYGFTAGSIILDAPILLRDEISGAVWRPSNYGGDFEGPIRLNRALARSRNLCTVRIAQEMGMDKILQRAKDLGFRREMPPYLSTSLGAGEVIPMDIISSYTAFANKGQRAIPRLIQKVTGPFGNVLYEKAPEHVQAISEQNAYVMAKILQGTVQIGTSTKAKSLKRPIAGKTGTTNDEIDAWFIGFSPDIVAGTYIGHDQIESMGRGETGAGAALPIYIEYAKEALNYYPTRDFDIPEGIYFVNANSGVVEVKAPVVQEATQDGEEVQEEQVFVFNADIFPLYTGTSLSTGLNAVGKKENKEVENAENIFMQGF